MDEKPKNLNSYHSKIVGVTFEGRQDVINQMFGNEQLRFRREPENEYDPNAVAVDALVQAGADQERWLPIGYIARDKNSELAELLTDGRYASISVASITGGEYNVKTKKNNSFGVNVYIEHERKVNKSRSAHAVLVKDFFGNEIFYDPVLHEYTNALGEVYLSGSAFAGGDDFDADYWANEAVTRYKLDPSAKERIKAMWNTNGEASRTFGTALHAAIELYGEYHDIADIIDMDLKTGKRKELSKGVEKNSALSKLPYLNKVARTFFTEERKAEQAYYEVLVVDHKNKRAGRIDRLVIYEDGTFAIRDMKTNGKIGVPEKRGYTKQLSFYADLVIANGRELTKVKPIAIHHWTEEDWIDIPLDKIDTLEPEVKFVEPTPKLVTGESLSKFKA